MAVPTTEYIYIAIANCVASCIVYLEMLLLSLEESRNVSPCLVCVSPARGGVFVCVLFMT